nr:hypothetical protein [Kofleriaceae bacterium]
MMGVVLLLGAGTASAQPADPYGPSTPPATPPASRQPPPLAPPKTPPAQPPQTPPAQPPQQLPVTAPPANPEDPYGATDPALAESVAASLVDRAQDLLDARQFADAKQLAIEAIATAPHGPSAERAQQLLRSANAGLGLRGNDQGGHRAPPPPPSPPLTDTTPIPQPGSDGQHDALPPPPSHGARVAASVYTGLYGAALGAALGTAFSSDSSGQAEGGVALGAVGGAAGAVFIAPMLDRKFSPAQVKTIGAGSLWGGVVGGLMADITTGTGSDSDGTSTRQVLIGASLGGTVGGLAGWGLAKQDKLTEGDVALVNTLAGIGAVGGLTLGMLMQPAQSEAYDVNSVIGIGAGIVVGLVYAPQSNTTERRMVRVAGVAAAGAAVPFLLYPLIYDSTSDSDERLVGLLSTTGLVAGTILGFRWTKHVDEGLDVKPSKQDAPPAVVGLSSDGSWSLAGLGVQPLSRQLDNHQHGTTLTVFSAAF